MKKLVSVLLALSVLLSAAAGAFAYEGDIKSEGAIYLDFEGSLPESVTAMGGFSYTEGVEGSAGLFNGSDAYLVLPDNITRDVTDFTIGAWVRFDSITPNVWQRIFDFGSDAESCLFLGTWQWEGSNNVRGSVKGNGQPTSFGVYSLGEWVHYVLRQSGDKLNLYINGTLTASSDASVYLKDCVCVNNYIGYYNKNTEPTSYFSGAIDEFFFAPYALEESDINDLVFEHLSDEDKADALMSRVYLKKNGDDTFSYFSYDDSHSSVKWISSAPEILTAEDGMKGKSPALCDVTLTAVITSGEVRKTIDYSFVAGDFSGTLTFMRTTLEEMEIDSIRKNAKAIDTDKTYLIRKKGEDAYLTQSGDVLALTEDKADKNALWRFYKSPKDNNSYAIFNVSDGMCLNVKNFSLEKNAEVILYKGGKGMNELWYVTEADGKCGILSYLSEWFLCGDFTLKGLSDFTDWEIIEAENTLLQYGRRAAETPSEYYSFDEGYYYALKYRDGYLNSELSVSKSPADYNAQWIFTDTGEQYYTVTSRASGMNLNIAGASTSPGADVILYPPTAAGNEQFSFKATPFGYLISGRDNKSYLTADERTCMTQNAGFWQIVRLGEREEDTSFLSALTDYIPYVTEEINPDTGFIHPGILITKDDIVRMQTKVREGAEPWASSFKKLCEAGISRPDARIYAYDSNADTTALKTEARLKNMRMDSRTAVNQALMYVITGGEEYRNNTMTILRMWSKLRDVYQTLGSDRIDHGEIGFKMAFAAELMKYTSCENPDLSWTEYDNEQFILMLETIRPKHDCWWYWMNQHSIGNMATMANAVFRNDAELYKTAVERTTVNSQGGGSMNYQAGDGGAIVQVFRTVDRDAWNGDNIEPTFVHAEMGRDQGHAYGNLGALSICAMMSYKQNTRVDPKTGEYSEDENAVNIFEFADERLLQAASYIGKYNLGYDVSHPTIDTGSGYYTDINDTNRGAIYTAFGILFNYCKYEKGADMNDERYRYLREAHEYNYPEGMMNDFYVGFSDLLFAPDGADGTLHERSGESGTLWQAENFTAVNCGEAEKSDGYAKITLDSKAQIALTNGWYPPSVKNSVVLRVRTNSEIEVILQNEHTVNAPFVTGIIPDTNGEWTDISFTVQPEGVLRQRLFFLTFRGNGEIDIDYMKFTE